MIKVRKANERGHTKFGWLDSRHSFSFGDYHDPSNMSFRTLRVINDDRIGPAGGFGTHPHRDMEIISYVVDGAMEHKDSMGNGSVIHGGEFQRMTAGTGVSHSEFNHSRTEPLHLYQIWIYPEQPGLEPGYEERAYAPKEKHGRLRLVASRDGRDGSMTIHQDAALYLTALSAGESVEHTLAAGRGAWVQIVAGEVELNGMALKTGDGAAVTDETVLTFKAKTEAELLLFDLA